jgi:hypothetical protein
LQKRFCHEWFKKQESLLEWFGLAFWFMVVLGLLWEFGEIRKSEKEASELNDRASTNELQVAVLSNETVRLSINLEGAKSNNLVMRKQYADLVATLTRRSFPLSDQLAASHNLRQFAGVKTIVIHAEGPDSEPGRLAAQISAVLEQSGWPHATENDVWDRFKSVIPEGVTVETKAWGETIPAGPAFSKFTATNSQALSAATALVKELNKIGINATHSRLLQDDVNFRRQTHFVSGFVSRITFADFPENTVVVWVGLQPNPLNQTREGVPFSLVEPNGSGF